LPTVDLSLNPHTVSRAPHTHRLLCLRESLLLRGRSLQLAENTAFQQAKATAYPRAIFGQTSAFTQRAGWERMLETSRPHMKKEGETAMENSIGFAAVAGAIFVSFAVALGIEWLSLVLLMKMMPAHATSQSIAQRMSSLPERSGREGLSRAA
jgi:hypothetical protein